VRKRREKKKIRCKKIRSYNILLLCKRKKYEILENEVEKEMDERS